MHHPKKQKKKSARKRGAKPRATATGERDALGRRLRVERRRIEQLRKVRRPDPEHGCHPMLPVVQRVARAVRLELKLSHNAVWELSTLRRSCIAKFEGAKPTGTINTLLWLCWAYGVRPSEFFERVEQEHERRPRI